MTVAAHSGVERSAGDPPARRLGIRAKLFLAFLGFAGLTVAACAVAWLVFVLIERSVNRVTQDSVPGMAAALALSKTVADISASAPALFASADLDELNAQRSSLEGDLYRFTSIVATLDRIGDREAEQAAPVSDAAGALVAKLDELGSSVQRRLALKKRRESITTDLHEAHSRFNETLEPLVDDAVFDLVISGEEVMADNTTSINSLVDNGVSRIDYLLSINAAVNLAAGLMGQAINLENPILLEPIKERFLSASLAIERNLRQLPAGTKTDALERAASGLLGLGRDGLLAGDRSVVADSIASSASVAAVADRLKQRHEQVLFMLTPMIDDAAFDLVMSTEDLTARSEAAIAGLIDGNADILGLMLTAQAEGNLVASILSDAAVAPDENLLLPLSERFTASEARLTSVLDKVGGADFYDDLSQSTNALLDFGRDDAGVFALRRSELEEAAEGAAALDDSRTLAGELGELASVIVANAEAAARTASASSESAIDSAQVVLVLITLVGLASAAIVMFRYVDPRIIRPVGRITSAMTQLAAGDTTVDIPGRDRKDEIGDMARALGVFRDNAIAVQEANLREIQLTRQRLADAIESISEGFSLYDADDRLVISNNRYKEMLYPDMPEMVVPGVTFEELLRRNVAKGLIVDAEDDPEAWIAERLRRRQDPGPSHVQQRSNGRYIMVSERKTEDGGTVAVYSDITELKQRETELAQKSLELEQLAGQLAKYLSPQVYESIFTGRQEVKLASERKKLTVFFSDIVDFTATSEKLQPEDLTLLLNEYLTEMANIALSFGATIDKYVGDAIVIFFGDPETRGVQEDALSCVEMAIAMRDKMHELQEGWRDRGVERPLNIRIGINTGYCTVGNFGSEARMDYTIIGANVNLAARLESASEHGGILVSHETYAQIKDRVHCEPQEPIKVKGFSQPVATYRVVDTYERLGRHNEVVRAQLLNLHLEMDAGAMSPSERHQAEAALRQALERLSSGAAGDDG